ncbi:MAG: EFR1 family ferrodoxin [Clostridia bacterium]|nr:EFR1 family ferrodoxin [Clostridia bacterium]
MIFYFSGTGNSLYAAKYIANNIHDDELVNMADSVKEGRYYYALKPGETCGFVFPVYFGGMPSAVAQFVKKLRLSSDEVPYVYALVTYGGKAGGSVQALQIALEKRYVYLSAAFGVKMPDNYVIMYNPATEEKAQQVLREAETDLLTAATNIIARNNPGVPHTMLDTVMTAGMQTAYRMMRKTASFTVDNSCIGCGLCEKICPVNAIEMYDYKPVWIKSECAHCVACISRCPAKAIQYGDKTKKRGRYVHPDLQVKQQTE